MKRHIQKEKKRRKKISYSPYRVLQIGALLHQVLGTLELAFTGGIGQSCAPIFILECEGAHEGGILRVSFLTTLHATCVRR